MKTERIPAPICAFQVPGLNAVDGEKKVILMAHGFGSEKRGTTPLFMTKGLKAAGFGVYGFDFPAHGDSPLDGAGLTVENCMESCAAAEARVRELAPGAEIGYFGSSYGAYCFLLYLATRPHHGEKAFLRSAAVDMPGLIWRVAEENGGLSADGYVDLNEYNRPIRLWRAFCEDLGAHDVFQIYRPGAARLRMIHGEKDSTASPAQARRFAREKGAELILFPGAEHRLMEPGNPDKALGLAIEFFRGD